MLNEYFLNLNLSLYAYDVHFCHLPGMHCPDEGLAAAAARVENGWSPGMRGDRGCGIGGGPAGGGLLVGRAWRGVGGQPPAPPPARGRGVPAGVGRRPQERHPPAPPPL